MNPLIRCIPAPLVRFFARPYVAGDSLTKAMAVVDRLWHERQLVSTLDLLAEDISEPHQAQRNLEAYLEMVDAVADCGLPPEGRPTLSLKPSSFTVSPLHEGGSGEGSFAAVERIAVRARERGVSLTVDMEGRHWTDFTLDALQRLHRAGHAHVGCVVQTRLHRTERDLDGLPPGIRVRLVIGIYREPSDIALTDKPAMKERLLTFAERLLRAGHYVEFATHDEAFVRRLLTEVVPRAGVGNDRFEVQMLYGVPRDRLQRELTAGGIRCRLYVPFALGWGMAIEYLRRRLDEYPAMVWLVTKNMLRFR
ncbi:MAG: proline dehydrogenase family protein [Planctomycetes bacterium]|nr:proline dehydrogenase family protein [Planctomycetota bacterium]